MLFKSAAFGFVDLFFVTGNFTISLIANISVWIIQVHFCSVYGHNIRHVAAVAMYYFYKIHVCLIVNTSILHSNNLVIISTVIMWVHCICFKDLRGFVREAHYGSVTYAHAYVCVIIRL